MQQQAVVDRTTAYVRDKFSGEGSGHDWWHIHRVYNSAMQIAAEESGADLFVVQLAALLHDIADWKFNGGDHSAGSRAARAWLESQAVEPEIIRHVEEIIDGISFKGAGEKSLLRTIEGMIVQDADRLDAIGATGIGRAFAYGGHARRVMHDPDAPPLLHQNFEQYKNSKGTTINHFHEKLLLLKDRMNTTAGKRRAGNRRRFMELFLKQFHDEWNGG